MWDRLQAFSLCVLCLPFHNVRRLGDNVTWILHCSLSATSVQCSCLFPNMKVNVSQRVRYRSYSPCVSVCNTFPEHKPGNECFKSLFLKRNRKKGELDCGVYSEELYLLQRKIYKMTSLKFKRQYLFDPLINVVWRQPRILKTEGSCPLNRHPILIEVFLFWRIFKYNSQLKTCLFITKKQLVSVDLRNNVRLLFRKTSITKIYYEQNVRFLISH